MVAVLVAHAVATLAMLGLVWFVQVVHYPMFALVGGEGLGAYSQEHSRRTGWVVGPLMLLEAATALALLVVRPDGVPALAVWLAVPCLSAGSTPSSTGGSFGGRVSHRRLESVRRGGRVDAGGRDRGRRGLSAPARQTGCRA